MKLFEITNEFQNVFNQVDENGEITEEMLSNLDNLRDDFEHKALSVAAFIKNIEAEEFAISTAINDMATRRKRLSKQIESLTDYLQFNLEKLSINEIKTSPYFKIRLKQCPPSVDVFDETMIPPEFWREKVIASVDKVMLKDALNEGVEVPGASIQRRIKLEIK